MALALVLAGCGQVSKGPVRRTVAINTNNEAGAAQFQPLQTTVQKGDKVTIVVINRTNRVHGFAVRGYGVPPIEVAPDAPNDMVFTAKKQGTFEIYCQLHETHRRAALLVE
ncbi:MAG: cupredoxin domain-containing protein [Actinomycetota bacterium]|nr:cupredoxin domain-containing protein [Actinomycetota bacterium]